MKAATDVKLWLALAAFGCGWIGALMYFKSKRIDFSA